MQEHFEWETIDLASLPRLPIGEIHIFATTLRPDLGWSEDANRILDDVEKARAARFRFEEHRYCYQKTRTLLRLLLSKYLSREPQSIKFREGSHGKPYLSESDSDLQFNVSHTKGASVLAFTRGIELGIDIEHARRKIDIEGVGRRVFTPAELSSVSELGAASGLRQFFRFWTAKEAYLKATGSGLSCDPASIEAKLDVGRYSSAVDPGTHLPYRLHEIPTGNHFLVSMAHQSCDEPEIRLSEIG